MPGGSLCGPQAKDVLPPAGVEAGSAAKAQPALRPVLWALAALLGVWALSSLWWPYYKDQAEFAWGASVMLRGGTPYLDTFDNQAPGAYLQYALVQRFAGTHMWPMRALDIVFLLITAWAMIRICTALGSRTAGFWAAAIFVCYYASTGYSNTAQRDGWGMMASCWALALGVGSTRQTLRAVSAGVLVAYACLLKPPIVVVCLPVAAMFLECAPRPLGFSRAVSTIILPMVAGFLAPVFAVLYWLGAHGALADAYQQVVVVNRQLYTSFHHLSLLASSSKFLLVIHRDMAGLVVGGLVGAAYLLSTRPRAYLTVATIYPASVLLSVVVQGKYYIYHWHGVRIACALLMGLALEHWGRKADKLAPPRLRRVAIGALACVVLLGLAQPLRDVARSTARWARYVVAHPDTEAYLSRFAQGTRGAAYNFLVEQRVARYITDHTSPDETIQMWGNDPLVVFLSKRRSATRFAYVWEIVLAQSRDRPLYLALISEYMKGMKTVRPTYFVLADDPPGVTQDVSCLESFRREPELAAFIRENYRREAVIGSFQLYRRIQPNTGQGTTM